MTLPSFEVLDAQLSASVFSLSRAPAPALVEVAFAGRSNVGKSSLLATLVQRRKLVRTSSEPGCTRGIHIYRVRTRTLEIDLVDLPGYGYAHRSRAEQASWKPLVEGFLRARSTLGLMFLLVDARRGIEDEDKVLLTFAQALAVPVAGVATKLDKIAKSRRFGVLSSLRAAFRPHPLVGFSALTGEGREEIAALMVRAATGQQ